MSDYPDRVWITEHSHGISGTSCERDGAQEYIRADIARDAIRLVVSIAEGYGIDSAEMLRLLQSVQQA